MKQSTPNLKTAAKDVAIFEHGDLAGFEELMRCFILTKDDKPEKVIENGKSAEKK